MSFLTSQYTFVMTGGTQRRNKQNRRIWQNNGQSDSLPFRNKTQRVSVSLQPRSLRSVTAQFRNKSITCLADWPTGWRVEAGRPLFNPQRRSRSRQPDKDIWNKTPEKALPVTPLFSFDAAHIGIEWHLITVFHFAPNGSQHHHYRWADASRGLGYKWKRTFTSGKTKVKLIWPKLCMCFVTTTRALLQPRTWLIPDIYF